MRLLVLSVVLTCFAMPAGVAVAADRPTVAVIGVHGAGDQRDDDLLAISDDVVTGFKIDGRFQVVYGDDLRSRFVRDRDRVLDQVFVQPAREAIEEGRVLYRTAQPDAAIRAFRRAEAALEPNLEFIRDQRLLIDVQLHLGLSYLSLGKKDQAAEAFGEVVRLAPDRILDTVEYPPRVVELFESVRTDVLSREGGRIKVSIDQPTGVRVYLDGRAVGSGNVRLQDIPPGYHALLAEADGRGRFFEEFTLASGEERAIDAQLEQRGLVLGGADVEQDSRSPLTRRLYRELAQVTGTDLLVMAAFDPDNNFHIALYSARSDTFSLDVKASLAAAPAARGAFVRQLVERVALYAEAVGVIKPERVSTELLPMRLGTNPVLRDYLFGPRTTVVAARAEEPVDPTPARGRNKKPVRAGAVVGVVLGILGAGAAATGIYYGVRPPPEAVGAFVVVIP